MTLSIKISKTKEPCTKYIEHLSYTLGQYQSASFEGNETLKLYTQNFFEILLKCSGLNL